MRYSEYSDPKKPPVRRYGKRESGVWEPRKENADVRAQKSATREELLAAGG